jgi:hypothetical protein
MFGQARSLLGRAPTWAIFLVGALCGAILTTTIGIVWNSHSTRSAEDDISYDNCLMQSNGNTVVCDAMMRSLERGRVERERLERERVKREKFEHEKFQREWAAATLKQKAEIYLAAGFSKREIVEHLKAQGFGDSDVSDAVGISLQDYQQGKY